MCAVSAVMDYGQRDIWPYWDKAQRTYPWTQFPQTNPLPPVPIQTDEQKLREFMKLYEAAKRFDEQTAQPDCEDPIKMQVLERILERLDEIEGRLT